jgi:uncharacterized protein with FMN-binding domain
MRTSTLKPIAALALTGAGSALILGFKTTDVPAIDTTGTTGSNATAGSGTSSGTGSTTGSSSGSTAASGATSGSSGSSSSGSSGSTASTTYADGTWTGDAVSEPWGKFQVAVVISNGAISSVSVVRSPSDRHSSSINSQAVPMLTQSVMASGGTSIDMVSGATWTSESYSESLQSALDAAAKAA